MITEVRRRWGGWKMDGYVKGFIVCSLGYLLLGAALGFTMAVHDALVPGSWSNWTWLLLPTHTHVLLIGWLSMMVFGVGYHMIPRFSGFLVWSPRLAWTHFWLANLGLWGMGTGFWLNRLQEDRWGWLVGAGGACQGAAFFCFAVNLSVTIWLAGGPRPVMVPEGESLATRLAARVAAAASRPPVIEPVEPSQTPASIIGRIPGALDVFLSFGFAGLADPEHVRTMASRITLAQAAARHGVNLADLVAALNAAAAAPPARPKLFKELGLKAAPEACCPECAEKEGHAHPHQH